MSQTNIWARVQQLAARDFTLFGLKFLLIAWAVGVIIAALLINNKWLLAGLLAYEVLP